MLTILAIQFLQALGSAASGRYESVAVSRAGGTGTATLVGHHTTLCADQTITTQVYFTLDPQHIPTTLSC